MATTSSSNWFYANCDGNGNGTKIKCHCHRNVNEPVQLEAAVLIASYNLQVQSGADMDRTQCKRTDMTVSADEGEECFRYQQSLSKTKRRLLCQ